MKNQLLRGDYKRKSAKIRGSSVKLGVALEDGYRESEQSWKELLLDLKSRGCRAPQLAIGDGALKGWRKLRGFRQLADVINNVKFIDGIDEKTVQQQKRAA